MLNGSLSVWFVIVRMTMTSSAFQRLVCLFNLFTYLFIFSLIYIIFYFLFIYSTYLFSYFMLFFIFTLTSRSSSAKKISSTSIARRITAIDWTMLENMTPFSSSYSSSVKPLSCIILNHIFRKRCITWAGERDYLQARWEERCTRDVTHLICFSTVLFPHSPAPKTG